MCSQSSIIILVLILAFISPIYGLHGKSRGRHSRSFGQTLNGWCEEETALKCAMSGAECAERQGLVDKSGYFYTRFCRCKLDYVEYQSKDYGRRCKPKKSLDLASQPGDCEIDEDCVEYGKNAVCNTDTGNCACPRNMTLYGDSPPGVEQCRAYDCEATGQQCLIKGAECTGESGAKKCVCPATKPLALKGTCTAAWDVLCASAADCPSVASGPMLCEKGTCACPSKGSMPAVLTMVGDDLQCKATVIGDACQEDNQCPANAHCSLKPKGRCICKDYYKPAGSTCKYCDLQYTHEGKFLTRL